MHASRGWVFNEVKHNSGEQQEIFQGRGGFVELGHFDSLRSLRRRKFWSFSSYILLKLHFEWKIELKDGYNQRLFF